jgi:predicted ArsR family transcriptional regulator
VDSPAPIAADDVLAQPTRARLFALLEELQRPTGTVELADRVGLHANGVRAHLGRMEHAGLVQRTRARHGPGRPPDAWTIAPDAHPGGSPPRAYRALARWLARAIGPGRGLRGIEQTGREIGRELAPERTSAPIEALQNTLSALGFQPAAPRRHQDSVTFCLGNCPYRDAVHENQPAICTLHEGITRGLLETLAPHAKLAAFVPRDPDMAGCTIEVRGLEAPPER